MRRSLAATRRLRAPDATAQARRPSSPSPRPSKRPGSTSRSSSTSSSRRSTSPAGPAARQIATQLALSFPVVDEVLAFLKREQLAEVVGSSGMGEQLYQYSLSTKGLEKAEEALARNHYIGPAPVPFEVYLDVLKRQSITLDPRLAGRLSRQALSHLVLDPQRRRRRSGPAVNSGRSMLLYGGSGNGKSTITTAIGRMLPGRGADPVRDRHQRHHHQGLRPARAPRDSRRPADRAPERRGVDWQTASAGATAAGSSRGAR